VITEKYNTSVNGTHTFDIFAATMIVLYNIAIALVSFGIRLAGYFNKKAHQFTYGRKDVYQQLEQETLQQSTNIWVHCASLGEFEQGRPIIEALKQEFPQIRIVLTFFSPSGYELRKKYPHADYVVYLPWDTRKNAQKFITLVNPRLAIFIKYEFWHHYTKTLSERNIPVYSVSSIFRDDQVFFHPYGGFFRNILKNFSQFFVQNDESVKLLRSIGITNVQRTGDTRFDRVHQIVTQGDEIAIAKRFKGDQKVFVVGSCWPEDLDVITPLINEQRLKFILAPHEINESFLTTIEKALQVKSIRYSAVADKDLEEYQVLLVDNIGLLSRLYRYGEFAYVGGAFGKGLHNILEAACYGVPIFFGNKNFQKFQEATDLINRGGAFEVRDYPDLKAKYEMLNLPESFLLACEVTRQYVEENLGATNKILQYCRNVLKE
jgi:3-deoxy-D-manno-octulosonic-acid transferase